MEGPEKVKAQAGPQKVRVHQYHHSVREMDAVTTHMRFIQSSLAKVGISGALFTSQKDHPKDFMRFQKERAWDCDLLLLHHSQGNPDLQRVLNLEVPKTIVYHNITPAEYFRHDPFVKNLCELGRRQLELLKHAVVASLADSETNAEELKARGFVSPQVFPLLDLSKISAPPHPQKKQKTRLLFVGRICPHKNQAFLIKVLYTLRHRHKIDASLRLIGSQDPLYGNYLRLLARALEIDGFVEFKGAVSKDVLRNSYQQAGAFVCASQHEGFCIPLVEAMQADLPVFALPAPGVVETLRRAGQVVKETTPEAFATALVKGFGKSRNILDGQKERLREMAQFQNPTRLQEMVVEIVDHVRHRRAGSPIFEHDTIPKCET